MAFPALITGCGSEPGSGSGPEVERLSKVEAVQALLTQENVGQDDFKLSKDDDEDDDSSLGCLDALDDQDDAPTDVERNFVADTEIEAPTIISGVASYDKVSDASDSFESARDAFDDCHKVNETDKDGAVTKLNLTVDEEKTTSKADEQLNVVGVGSVESNGFEVPVGIWFSAVRIDNHLTLVGMSDLETDKDRSLDDLVKIAVDRLEAVAAGEEPKNVSASGDSSDDSAGADSESSAAKELPLDGGSHTWDNGVTMKLSVQRVEPWGTFDDFCGDGSCGVANRDDTRFVIRYDVAVPQDFDGPFDPSSCPGTLLPKEGNDEEALSSVAGDYSKQVEGKIFPGGAKFGIDEYYIEKAYAGGEFYIESSCGDTEFDGETVIFSGPAKKTA